MLMGLFAFHYHIVDVSLHVSSQLGLEDLCDQPLICSLNVLESEWHHFVTVGAYAITKDVWVSSSGFILIK